MQAYMILSDEIIQRIKAAEAGGSCFHRLELCPINMTPGAVDNRYTIGLSSHKDKRQDASGDDVLFFDGKLLGNEF